MVVNLHLVVLLKKLEAGSGPGSGRWVVGLLLEQLEAVVGLLGEQLAVVVELRMAVVLLK